MNTPTTEKKTRTPRSYDDILRGALSLTLKERASLVAAVSKANQEEATLLKQQADEAAKLVGNEGEAITNRRP